MWKLKKMSDNIADVREIELKDILAVVHIRDKDIYYAMIVDRCIPEEGVLEICISLLSKEAYDRLKNKVPAITKNWKDEDEETKNILLEIISLREKVKRKK